MRSFALKVWRTTSWFLSRPTTNSRARRALRAGRQHAAGGDRVRISAQLIDAATGAHRWAEHYDRKIDDVLAVQDEVVRTIVSILAAHVKKAEIERTLAKSPNSWKAYDYYLQASD